LAHNVICVTDSNQPTTANDLTALADLDRLRDDFPAFRIWREITPGRIVYIARRRHPGTQPHTLVTPDPAELRTALTGNPPQEPPRQP
jgi:hypothetical protein